MVILKDFYFVCMHVARVDVLVPSYRINNGYNGGNPLSSASFSPMEAMARFEKEEKNSLNLKEAEGKENLATKHELLLLFYSPTSRRIKKGATVKA